MKITIVKGYVTKDKELFGKGDTVEVLDAIGNKLVNEGWAVMAQPTFIAETVEDTVETTEVDTNEENAMDLPDVDAAAVVKKGKAK